MDFASQRRQWRQSRKVLTITEPREVEFPHPSRLTEYGTVIPQSRNREWARVTTAMIKNDDKSGARWRSWNGCATRSWFGLYLWRRVLIRPILVGCANVWTILLLCRVVNEPRFKRFANESFHIPDRKTSFSLGSGCCCEAARSRWYKTLSISIWRS